MSVWIARLAVLLLRAPTFVVLGAAMIAAAFAIENPLGLFCLGFPGAFVLVLSMGALAARVSARRAAARLGHPQIRIHGTPRRGEELVVELTLAPKHALTVGPTASITLRCRERAGSHTRDAVELQQPLAAGASLLPGTPVTLRHTFRIPADAPPTLITSAKSATWRLHLHLPLTPGPDWSEKHVLVVEP